jgi:hypothetical protein
MQDGIEQASRPRTVDFTWGKPSGRRKAAVREWCRDAARPGLARARGGTGRGSGGGGGAPGTRHPRDGAGRAASAAWSTGGGGERRPATVEAVGGRRRAVRGEEGRRGVGRGRGHQRWQRRRAGETEDPGVEGGDARMGKEIEEENTGHHSRL